MDNHFKLGEKEIRTFNYGELTQVTGSGPEQLAQLVRNTNIVYQSGTTLVVTFNCAMQGISPNGAPINAIENVQYTCNDNNMNGIPGAYEFCATLPVWDLNF